MGMEQPREQVIRAASLTLNFGLTPNSALICIRKDNNVNLIYSGKNHILWRPIFLPSNIIYPKFGELPRCLGC